MTVTLDPPADTRPIPPPANLSALRTFIWSLYIIDKRRGSIQLGPNMTPAQDRLLTVVEEEIAARRPVRIIIAKARQMGFSTMVEAIMFAMCFLQSNMKALVISHKGESSEHILQMSHHFWDTFWARSAYTTKSLATSRIGWVETNSQIHVATAGALGSSRSFTLHFLHASEAAFWPKNPDVLLSGLNQTFPTEPLTFQFFESTSNGVGNWWHKMVNATKKGDNAFRLVFFGWWEHPDYCASKIGLAAELTIPLTHQSEEEEALYRFLERRGFDHATIHDKLIWRRYAIANLCMGSLDTFHQEYPTTLDESFVNSGRNVFPIDHLRSAYDPLTGTCGDLQRRGNRIEFIPNPDGPLRVFRKPSRDLSHGIYTVGGDPSFAATGDYSCIQVLNRRTWEQVAVYRAKLDAATVGEKMDLIGHWYNQALAAPEATKGGGAAVGALKALNYPHLFIHRKVGNVKGQIDNQYGWVTNSQTKPEAVTNLQKALYDRYCQRHAGFGLVIHDVATYEELKEYVVLNNGDFGNSDNTEHDDMVMALAIALTVTMYEHGELVGLTGPAEPSPGQPITRAPTDAELSMVNVEGARVGVEIDEDFMMQSEQPAGPWERGPDPEETNF